MLRYVFVELCLLLGPLLGLGNFVKRQSTYDLSSFLSLLTDQERDIVDIMFGRNHFSFGGVGGQVDDAC